MIGYLAAGIEIEIVKQHMGEKSKGSNVTDGIFFISLADLSQGNFVRKTFLQGPTSGLSSSQKRVVVLSIRMTRGSYMSEYIMDSDGVSQSAIPRAPDRDM